MQTILLTESPECINKPNAEEHLQRLILLEKGNHLIFVNNNRNRHYVEINNGKPIRYILKDKQLFNRLHSGLNYQCLLRANDEVFFGKYSNLTGKYRGMDITFGDLLGNDIEYMQWLVSEGYMFEPSLKEQIADKAHLAR
jgi:hypothetical protein